MNYRDYLNLLRREKNTDKPMEKSAFRKFQRKAMRSQLSKIRASMQEMAGCRHVVAPVPAWPSPVEQSPKTGRDSKRPGWARKRDRRRKERL